MEISRYACSTIGTWPGAAEQSLGTWGQCYCGVGYTVSSGAGGTVYMQEGGGVGGLCVIV